MNARSAPTLTGGVSWPGLNLPAYLKVMRAQLAKAGARTVDEKLLVTYHKGVPVIPREAARFVSKVPRVADATARPTRRPLVHKRKLRPYQQKAVKAALANPSGGVIVAPCGSGKTTMGCALIAADHTPALVLVPTLDLVSQWEQRIREELPGVKVGRWTDTKPPEAEVTVATIQGVSRRTGAELAKVANRWGLLVLDEAHHAPAATWSKVLAHLAARRRIGLTATPERLDGLDKLLHLHLGPIVAEVDRTELERTGATLAPEVRFLLTNHEGDPNDPSRNADLVHLARFEAASGHVVLLLVNRVEQARQLADALTAATLSAAALVGSVAEKERTRVLNEARAGRISCLVATQLADEGLDVPTISRVILSSSSGALGRIEQRIGRALRPMAGKPPVVVWDVVDANRTATALEREKLYDRLGWDYSVVRSVPKLPRRSR